MKKILKEEGKTRMGRETADYLPEPKAWTYQAAVYI
jgi:hypothetical protein